MIIVVEGSVTDAPSENDRIYEIEDIMLVVHMDSGLGNQMLDYAEYLAISKANPDKQLYLENLIYELPQKDGMFSIWNGYELERIFGISLPNVKERYSEEQWQQILSEVMDSRFWEKGWDYWTPIVTALGHQGDELTPRSRALNMSGSKTAPIDRNTEHLYKRAADNVKEETSGAVEEGIGEGKGPKLGTQPVGAKVKTSLRGLVTSFFQTTVGYHTKRIIRGLMAKKLVERCAASHDLFRVYPEDSFVGHSFGFKYKGFGQEKIEKEIREIFRFPEITDERNRKMQEFLLSHNAVSIHARRGDMLFLNGHCYKYGYFKRAVRYLKKKIKDPVFVFFTDETSVGWCQENEKIFGLDFTKDHVEFVDWNKGPESFRDMQLMTCCKANIFTESTFGFWGAFLNETPGKITCAPDPQIYATKFF